MLIRLSPFAVAHLAIQAMENFGAVSRECQVAATILEEHLPPFVISRDHIFKNGNLKPEENQILKEKVQDYRPDWPFFPFFQDVRGDGDCIDYCTIQSLGGDAHDSFLLRVLKGYFHYFFALFFISSFFHNFSIIFHIFFFQIISCSYCWWT